MHADLQLEQRRLRQLAGVSAHLRRQSKELLAAASAIFDDAVALQLFIHGLSDQVKPPIPTHGPAAQPVHDPRLLDPRACGGCLGSRRCWRCHGQGRTFVRDGGTGRCERCRGGGLCLSCAATPEGGA